MSRVDPEKIPPAICPGPFQLDPGAWEREEHLRAAAAR